MIRKVFPLFQVEENKNTNLREEVWSFALVPVSLSHCVKCLEIDSDLTLL